MYLVIDVQLLPLLLLAELFTRLVGGRGCEAKGTLFDRERGPLLPLLWGKMASEAAAFTAAEMWLACWCMLCGLLWDCGASDMALVELDTDVEAAGAAMLTALLLLCAVSSVGK